jgi:hypothetical protein
MNFLFKHLSLFLFILTPFLFSNNALAQEETVPNDGGILPDGAVKVAAVNIYDQTIVSNDGSEVRISFQIVNEGDTANGDTVQSGVKYGLRLLKGKITAEEGFTYYGEVVDEYVFPDVLSLNPKEMVFKDVTYLLPPVEGGEYYINLYSENASGMPLTTVFIEEPLTLTTENEKQGVNLSTCRMLVEGEEEAYNLSFGVDVDTQEKLFFTCSVQVTAIDDTVFFPKVTLFERSIMGTKMGEETLAEMTFSETRTENVLFSVPLPEKPQGYDAELALFLEDGTLVSNRIIGHFVIRGVSATIQDVQLDKDRYTDGEKAQVVISVSGNASDFLGSRAYGDTFPDDMLLEKQWHEITIFGKDGVVCGKVLKRSMWATRWDKKSYKLLLRKIVSTQRYMLVFLIKMAKCFMK